MKIKNVLDPVRGCVDVTVTDGVVQAVVPHEPGPADAWSPGALPGAAGVVDAGGRLLLPSAADVHMHLDKSHTYASVGNESGTLGEAVANYAQFAPGVTEEDMLARMRKTALRALSFGTTAIRTHIDFHTRADEETTFRGIRCALALKEELAPWMTIEIYPMLPFFPYNKEDHRRIEKVTAMNIDGLGGAPHLSEAPEEAIDALFHYARESGLPIDVHTDESDDPSVQTVRTIAAKTMLHHMEGRVTVDHLCSLSAVPEDEAAEMIRLMKTAGLQAVTLPAANMYLQGREDRGLVRRGTTRIRELLDAGIPLASASDNVVDPFHPFGRGDLLQIAQLTGYAAHMVSPEDWKTLAEMISRVPKEMMGLPEGIHPGEKASFMIVDAFSLGEALASLPEERGVYHHGSWVASTSSSTQFSPALGRTEAPQYG
ncbi:amidohydrolase family protein [Alkalicoccus urumqiensis]|uniref:Amidohydrolase n=1 Tax=Alkalicoccus urumqiensis TaxID=1548213 RepID=A0A2P6MJG0_ALKUR|nr:amidohydrolase family protein [Alkalicoccus urumqiensis]PRO66434.1 amidohydrolase [Alkalicoccus urumqiensis]